MIPKRTLLLSLFLLLAPVLTPAQHPPELSPDQVRKAEQLREDLRQMIALARDRVFPALVNIRVITVRFGDGKEVKGSSVGSGTIISEQGHVLTNYHVVRNGKKFTCTLADMQEIPAELVGQDPLTDLAVIKLDLSARKDPAAPLPVGRFGNADELQVGDTVMAMGSPWSLSRSVTLGIVSNTERILAGDDDAPEMLMDRDQITGIFNRWIQHDAAINPGNSGGPLVNLKGEIVGVNTRGNPMGGDMGFAIPAGIARTVSDQLIQHGNVPRSAIGVTFRSLKDTGLDAGVLVNSIIEDGPAAKAGILAGDVIVSIDGDPITARFAEEIPPLMKRIADLPIGASVKLGYRREGAPAEALVVTVARQKERGEEAAFRAWGVTGQEITEQMARNRRLDSTAGVLVTSVRGGGPAAQAEPALDDGDVIRKIGGEPVNDLEHFTARYQKIMETEPLPEYVLIEFDRAGKSNVTIIKPRDEQDPDPPREVAKAWVGVAVQPLLPKLAAQLELSDTLGFRVTRVYPRTQAAEADLKVGDIITALNGENLRPRGMQDAGLFQRQVRRLEIDQTARLAVLRDRQPREIAVRLERTRLTPEEARRDRNSEFELTVRELTFFDRDENRWSESIGGVLIEQVERAGWAGLGGLQPGDLIQRVNAHGVADLESYRKAMAAISDEKPRRVTFLVLRGAMTRFLFVEPEWTPETTPAAPAGAEE